MTRRRPLLLVTGFGPFPLMPRNPSSILACRIAASPRWRMSGIDCVALELETSYGAIDDVLLPALARFKPDAVLLLGVAGRRKAISIELLARNRASRLFADAEGKLAGALALRPGMAPALRGRARTTVLLETLCARRLPARLSRDAGRYLCNAAYYAALDAPSVAAARIIFVHVPLARRGVRDPRPSLGAMASGLTALALALARGAAFSARSGRADRAASRRPG